MLRIAICDDSKPEIIIVDKNIRLSLKRLRIDFEVKHFLCAEQLLNENELNPFDVIFLDLDMPQINGLDAAEKIGEQNKVSEIVFVTNHDELVYKAFRFKALGFVRKKFIEEEVDEIIELVIKHINLKNEYILISDSGVEKKININDISYLQSDGHYVDIFTINGKEVVRRTLNDIEDEYAVYGFIRLHARYLVNYRFIHSIEKNTVVLTNQKQLPLSRSKVKDAKDSFQFFARRI